MMRLPRTIRLDPSDTLIYAQAAAPGEWAVPGSFLFWDDDPATLAGKRQQAFRGGFLGLGSGGWSTLVEVAAADAAAAEAALADLAALLRRLGAPDEAAARAAAAEEIAFAASLCAHPPGTVLAMTRRHDADGAIREQFRTLHRRQGPRDITALPVLGILAVEGEEAPPERPDLAALARQGGRGR
jgi:hypothetical protein